MQTKARNWPIVALSLPHKTRVTRKLWFEGLFIWARLTGLARLPRSRLTSKPFVKFSMCSYERAAWVGKRAGKFCHMNTSSHLPGWILRNSACAVSSHNKVARMASFCFAWWIFHIISNPFNCSGTAKRVAKAMKGAKVITQLRFAIFCFVFIIISR